MNDEMLVIVKSRGQEATLVDVMAIIDEMRTLSLGQNKVGLSQTIPPPPPPLLLLLLGCE